MGMPPKYENRAGIFGTFLKIWKLLTIGVRVLGKGY